MQFFFIAGNIALLPIATVTEGDIVSVCLQLSCVSCVGADPSFRVQVLLEIASGTASQFN